MVRALGLLTEEQNLQSLNAHHVLAHSFSFLTEWHSDCMVNWKALSSDRPREGIIILNLNSPLKNTADFINNRAGMVVHTPGPYTWEGDAEG